MLIVELALLAIIAALIVFVIVPGQVRLARRRRRALKDFWAGRL